MKPGLVVSGLAFYSDESYWSSQLYFCKIVAENNEHKQKQRDQCGEISPLWPNAKNLRLLFEVFFCIWQNFEPTWEIFNQNVKAGVGELKITSRMH